MLARNKLNSIESKISEALIKNEISHEDLMTIINALESIRMMNNQRSDTEKINLIEEGKRIDILIIEIIKHNEISLKSKI